MYELLIVNLEGLHYRKPPSNFKKASLPFTPEDGAKNSSWDPEALTLTYYTPNEPLGDGTPVDPTEHSRVITQAEIDAGIIEVETPSYNVENLIERLWEDFNRHAIEQTDLNSRNSISLLLADPSSTAQQVTRATEWGNWWASHWVLYGQKKAEILATGQPATYTFTDAPWTIWEISE